MFCGNFGVVFIFRVDVEAKSYSWLWDRNFYIESRMYFELDYIEIGFCGMLQKTNITLKNVQKFKSIVMVTLANKNMIFIYRRNFSKIRVYLIYV